MTQNTEQTLDANLDTKKENDREDIKLDNDSNSGDWDDFFNRSNDRNNTWPFKEDNPIVNGMRISWTTAEQITVDTIKAHLDLIYQRETDHKVFGEYYHEEDKEQDRKLKKSFKRILKFFGEEEL